MKILNAAITIATLLSFTSAQAESFNINLPGHKFRLNLDGYRQPSMLLSMVTQNQARTTPFDDHQYEAYILMIGIILSHGWEGKIPQDFILPAALKLQRLANDGMDIQDAMDSAVMDAPRFAGENDPNSDAGQLVTATINSLANELKD